MRGASRRLPAWVPVAVGLLGLHALVSFRFPWEETPWDEAWLRCSLDLVFLLSVGFALVLGFGFRAIFTHGLTLAFLLVPLHRFGSTVMPVFYGKELELYDDVLLLPGLAHLLLFQHAPWVQWLYSALAVLAAVLLYLLVHRMVRTTLRSSVHPRWSLAFLGACQLVMLAGWLDTSAAPRSTNRVWAEGLLPDVLRKGAGIHRSWRRTRYYRSVLARTEQRIGRLPADLGGLGGADVYVLFIESYGRVLFSSAETARAFAGWAGTWEAELEADGLSACSAYGTPSISGGASSRAHAEFLCGVQVYDGRAFDSLLRSSLKPMPRFFGEAGYRTLNVQPATTMEWPEGSFYGFDEDLFFDWFAYEGYSYHWGFMPDQYALSRLLENVIRGSTEPLFVQYVSVTSHAPFKAIPPYYEDWSAAAAPAAFAGEPARSYPINWVNYAVHPDLVDAYMDVVEYSMRTMLGFARELPRPSLVFILGDHQPPNVGDLRKNDSSFDVPVHVVSNDQRLLEPFLRAGFQPGLVPHEGQPSFSTSWFLEGILRWFGEGGR